MNNVSLVLKNALKIAGITLQTMPANMGTRTITEFGYKNAAVTEQNFRDEYIEHLMSFINVKAIKKAKLKVGIDPLFGAADNYFRHFLTKCGGVEIYGINEGCDVLFGGRVPNAGPVSLNDLSKLVVSKRLHLGIACNSDCDKFGIIGPDGIWISPNQIVPVLLEHVILHGWIWRTGKPGKFASASSRHSGAGKKIHLLI